MNPRAIFAKVAHIKPACKITNYANNKNMQKLLKIFIAISLNLPALLPLGSCEEWYQTCQVIQCDA